MHYTIGAILAGNDKILEYFGNAKGKWREAFDAKKNASVDDWAAWIGGEYKSYFDRECGGNLLGHEVMVWSAFGSLFSTQFGWQPEEKALAQTLAAAFAASTCTEDVKMAAAKAARLYDLEPVPATAPASDRDI